MVTGRGHYSGAVLYPRKHVIGIFSADLTAEGLNE
jgi:hypothetical protein